MSQQVFSSDAMNCEDKGSLVADVNIVCADFMSGRTLSVSPSSISSGDEFTVSDGNNDLPESISCTIFDGTTEVQRNAIALTGPLSLKEKFGALQIQSCDAQKCLQTAFLDYFVKNEGESTLQLLAVTRGVTGMPVKNLVSEFASKEIPPEGRLKTTETVELDVCVTNSIVTSATVEVQAIGGPGCEAQDEIMFQFNPTCRLDADLICEETSSGKECKDLQAIGTPQCACSRQCATELTFQYTGENCALQPPGDNSIICIDGPNKPETVRVQAGDLFDGVVSVGEFITLSDGGDCLDNDLTFFVTDAVTSDQYQRLVFQTGCSVGGIQLTDKFGGFDFSGFSCSSGLEENCFTEIDFEVCTVNESTVPINVTEITLNFDGGRFDLVTGTQDFKAGETICIRETTLISLCGTPSFEATVTVESDSDCRDSIVVNQELQNRPTSSPTESPSAAPSPSPSASPSSTPSVSPSVSPSSPPSSMPTRVPTTSPSSSPTSSPSASPSQVPSAAPSAAPSTSPSATPSVFPSATPTGTPSAAPSASPSASPTGIPSVTPTATPSATPSAAPSSAPTASPSANPTGIPSAIPTGTPSAAPSTTPSAAPSAAPTASPSATPTGTPSAIPTAPPSAAPSTTPSAAPSATPTSAPSATPTSSPSSSQCQAKVEITCVTESGVPCNQIQPPNALCESPNQISFTYDSQSNCDDSLNQQGMEGNDICEDLAVLEDSVTISCEDATTNVGLRVFPATVASGDEFTVIGSETASVLPETIRCIIKDMNGYDLQRNLIQTTGPLHLKEKYGSLQVQMCDDQDCLQTATMTYTVHNEGVGSMTVVAVTREQTGEDPKDLVSQLSSNPLVVGGRATATESFELDICQTSKTVTKIDVDAQPDDGPECDGYSSYVIEINPVCALDVTLTCTEDDTNSSCDELMSIEDAPCNCGGECATELSFVYTGQPCDLAGAGAFIDECDTNSRPRPDVVAVWVNSLSGTSYYSETIAEGDLITLGTGESCLPNAFVVRVTDPGNSNIVYETMTFRSECETDGIRLSSSHGPLDFVGFVCENGHNEFCFTDVTVSSCAMNEGTIASTITSASIKLDDDLVASAGSRSLDAGEVTCFEETIPLLLCGDASYVIQTKVRADDTSGIGCEAESVLLLSLEPRPTANPTASPSASPTAVPSASPTTTPSAYPTATPSVYPTATPSAYPTATPSAYPTATPSAYPTASPTPIPTWVPTARITARPVTGVPTSVPTPVPTANIDTLRPVAPPVKPPPTHKGKGKGAYKGKGKGKGGYSKGKGDYSKGKGKGGAYYSKGKGNQKWMSNNGGGWKKNYSKGKGNQKWFSKGGGWKKDIFVNSMSNKSMGKKKSMMGKMRN
eukprot:scaffold178_cov163-Amphora_coffeaeformis.AAC.10